MNEPALRVKLTPVLELLARDPASLSSVRDFEQAWRIHVEDSLSGLDLLGSPGRLADVGTGAGFPGVVLAAALPDCRVDLIESVARKCGFMERALAAAGIENARVICERAETWAARPPPDGGRETYDVVTARAVGRLATLAELASPLLVDGGRLVAWKGRRNPAEEAEAASATELLAMAEAEVRAAASFAGAHHRHLHTLTKRGPTPPGLPRRPGLAKKRPFGRSGL